MVVLVTFKMTNLVKRVCLCCTIVLAHAHRTFHSFKSRLLFIVFWLSLMSERSCYQLYKTKLLQDTDTFDKGKFSLYNNVSNKPDTCNAADKGELSLYKNVSNKPA